MPTYELLSTILQVSDVSLKLGGNTILRDVNIDIRDIHRPTQVTGQVVALLGPSGIGKTRLFRVIAGLDAPDTGTVLIGEDARPVQRGMVGVVAQHYPLFEFRTILSNLTVAGRQAGLSRDAANAKANQFLERFKLADRAHYYPAQLSGGQRQRVAIAQQFMCSEHFLLMDEPFSGLDPVAVERVRDLILEVASEHTLNTIIVVTHDIVAAMEVSDTLWLLGRDRDANGRVIPGAKIQGTYKLMDMGLAWQKGISSTPAFLALLNEIRERFHTL